MGYAKVTLVSKTTSNNQNNNNNNKDDDDDETNNNNNSQNTLEEDVLDDNEISVDVFLPQGATLKGTLLRTMNPHNSTEEAPSYYYTASRFEHGSMIGNIRYKGHVLYGTDLWRMPHNSNWPESGVGLASEFGVGDYGDFCLYLCGWPLTGDITNGVLGYREAKNGQAFLKIGVGALLKGTCPACDSTDDYKFNSPYLFAQPPQWTVTQDSPQSISMFHQASLQSASEDSPPQASSNGGGGDQLYGYQLQKDIAVVTVENPNDNDDDSNNRRHMLQVTTTLTNTGREAFSTVWYSHNLFHCDGVAVGPGYVMHLNLTGTPKPLYEEPGTWSWATPLTQYARVIRRQETTTHNSDNDDTDSTTNNNNYYGVRVEMTRALDPGIRIKTEFRPDNATRGGFVLEACNTRIVTTLHPGNPRSSTSNKEEDDPLEMYAYGLYLERGTVSPEPQILLHVAPGQTKQWTQQLEFSQIVPTTTTNPPTTKSSKSKKTTKQQQAQQDVDSSWSTLASAAAASLVTATTTTTTRHSNKTSSKSLSSSPSSSISMSSASSRSSSLLLPHSGSWSLNSTTPSSSSSTVSFTPTVSVASHATPITTTTTTTSLGGGNVGDHPRLVLFGTVTFLAVLVVLVYPYYTYSRTARKRRQYTQIYDPLVNVRLPESKEEEEATAADERHALLSSSSTLPTTTMTNGHWQQPQRLTGLDSTSSPRISTTTITTV